jgi:hypothetical protein
MCLRLRLLSKYTRPLHLQRQFLRFTRQLHRSLAALVAGVSMRMTFTQLKFLRLTRLLQPQFTRRLQSLFRFIHLLQNLLRFTHQLQSPFAALDSVASMTTMFTPLKFLKFPRQL